MSEKTFSFKEEGVKFSVRVFEKVDEYGNAVVDDEGNPIIQAEITVTEGSADFNAIYWGDDEEGNSDFEGFSGRDSSLNMNGEGSQYEGEPVEWDGAQKISNPGFGPNSDEKTYLGAGDEGESDTSDPITLDGITSLDEIDFLGVRATSVGDDGGSIKAVSPPDEDPECPKFLDEWEGGEIDHFVFYFDTAGNGKLDYAVKMDMADYDTGDKTGGLTEEQFEDCLQNLRIYIESKNIEWGDEDGQTIDFDTTLIGFEAVGTDDDNKQFFLLDGDPEIDHEGAAEDYEDVDFDFRDDEDQTFWNYAYMLENHPEMFEQDCDCEEPLVA